jgi:hypothetical protein
MGAVIFGGYGIFGSLVARELSRLGISVAIVGRDHNRAQQFARTLGAGHRAAAADVRDQASCRSTLHEHDIAINCAGPFDAFGPSLLEACLEAECHYVDIADNRNYFRLVRSYDQRFRECGLAAVFGCSSLPGISGALAVIAQAGAIAPPQLARVTLFIGNKNPKGSAAVQSLLGGLGRPIAAPQGTLFGFHDREVVLLPPPFGKRATFNFDSPEYDVLPELFDVKSVRVKVGFEMRAVTYGLRALASLPRGFVGHAAPVLKSVGRLISGMGCSGGAVMTELFWSDGTYRRAALSTRADGQRMAALPCVVVAEALSRKALKAAGAQTAYEFCGANELLMQLVAEECTLSS